MEQAVKYYNQASALHGGNQGILLTLIRLYATLGDFKRVEELVAHITILAKVNDTKVPPIVFAYRARAEEELGEYESAIKDLKLFLQEQERSPTEGLSEEEKEARIRQLKEAREALERCRRKQAEGKPPSPPADERKEEPPPQAP
jgi:tetratricopeptide (TPR) repeat protein